MSVLPNELRIGNVTINPTDNKVSIISPEHISDIMLGYKKRDGIPLTPEILEKCGFGQSENETSYGCWIKRIGYNDWDQDFFLQVTDGTAPIDFCNIYSRDTPESNCQIFNTPRYLHQLQNLIHSLTGEELNIKL